MRTLVLASASPRRAELVRSLGLSYSVLPSDVPETLEPGEPAFDAAERLARLKATTMAAQLQAKSGAGGEGAKPGPLVLGADTLVVLDGQALGKPLDRADAVRMLRLLSGRAHDVVTGVALTSADPGDRVVSGREITRVTFAPLTEAEIEAYVATGEADDKAGAYGIQGRAGAFIERIEGTQSNVAGLPVRLVYTLLRDYGAAHRREGRTPSGRTEVGAEGPFLPSEVNGSKGNS